MAIKTYSSYGKDSRSGYSTFANDYSAYTTPLKYENPYFNLSDWHLQQPDAKIFNTFGSMVNQSYFDQQKQDAGRSLLGRAFDALSVGLYPTAGFIKGLVDNGQKDSITPWEGFSQGLAAANPFGKGFETGRRTYSDVIESLGWKPTSLGGKIGKGILSFGADVLLDPTTYLSGGLSPLLRGTGKGIEKMTMDTAKGIITKSNEAKSIAVDSTELDRQASELVQKYNQLKGVPTEGKGLSIGLQNLPFGSKLFPNAKSLHLMDDATLRDIGNVTLAPTFKRARDAFYGGVMGKLFSTDSTLYNLAQKDPTAVYDFLHAISITKGQKMDMLQAEKLIRDKSEYFRQLTPADMNDVLSMLQDKTVWSKVMPIIKLSKLQEATDYRKSLADRRIQSQQELDSLRQTQASLSDMANHYQGSIDKTKQSMQDLVKEFQRKVIEFDVGHNKTKVELQDYINTLTKDLNRPSATTPRPAHELKQAVLDAHDALNKGGTNRVAVIDSLNNFLGDDLIGKTVWNSKVNEVVKMVKDGKSKKAIRDHIENQHDLYSGMASDVYPMVGELMGYGSKMNYKTWDDMYHARIKPLAQKIARKEGLTDQENHLLLELEALNHKRNNIIHEITHRRTTLYTDGNGKPVMGWRKATSDEVLQYKNAHQNRELESILADLHTQDIEKRRAQFNADDSLNRNPLNFDRNRTVDGHTPIDNTASDMHILSHEDIVNARVDIAHEFKFLEKVNEHNIVRKFDSLTLEQRHMMDNVISEIPAILKEHFPGREFSSLNKYSKSEVYSLALKESLKKKAALQIDAEAMAKKVQSVIQKGNEQKAVKVGSVIYFRRDGKMDKGKLAAIIEQDGAVSYSLIRKDGSNVHINPNEMVHAYSKNIPSAVETPILDAKAETKRLLDETKAKLDGVSEEHVKQRNELIKEYQDKMDEMKSNVTKLNEDLSTLHDALNGDTLKSIDDVEKRLLHLDDAITSDDALETFMRMDMGNQHVDDLLKSHRIVMDALDAKTDVSERVKKIVRIIRTEFQKAAEAEIKIGKLSQEQVDANWADYVYHMLTPEGAKYVNSKEGRGIFGRKPSITQDLGYGLKWSPHSKTRTIKSVLIDGKWVEHPTIEQINISFKDKLHGKNIFSENIADLYLARMLKHTELIYDNNYMLTMLHTFGNDIGSDGVKSGYKAVMNIGMLRDSVNKAAQHSMTEEAVRGVRPSPYQAHIDSVIQKMGLTRNMLEEMATPMVELTKEQVSKIRNVHGSAQIKQVNEAIVQKANQARKLQLAKDQSRFLKMYDKITHLIKLNMTTVVPSFHARNKFSNMYLNWLAVGPVAFDFKTNLDAMRVVRAQGRLEGRQMLTYLTPDGKPAAMKWNDAYELAKAHNVIDEGFFAKDIGAHTATTGILPIRPKLDPTDSENFILYKKGMAIGNVVENSDRLHHFVALLKQGKTPEAAAESVNHFLFDYNDLTAFEQSVMKRIIPFYTFLRKNSALQIEQLLENPGKFQLVAKIEQGVEGASNRDERVKSADVAPFAQGWLQLPQTSPAKGQKQNPLLLNPNLPFMDLNRIPDPTQAYQSAKELFAQSNPIFKVPAEQIANRNVFFDAPIVKRGDNELVGRLDHLTDQNALLSQLKKLFSSKDGTNLTSNVINSTAGVKTSPYDSTNYKKILRQEQTANISGNDMPYYNPLTDHLAHLTHAVDQKLLAIKRRLQQK